MKFDLINFVADCEAVCAVMTKQMNEIDDLSCLLEKKYEALGFVSCVKTISFNIKNEDLRHQLCKYADEKEEHFVAHHNLLAGKLSPVCTKDDSVASDEYAIRKECEKTMNSYLEYLESYRSEIMNLDVEQNKTKEIALPIFSEIISILRSSMNLYEETKLEIKGGPFLRPVKVD